MTTRSSIFTPGRDCSAYGYDPKDNEIAYGYDPKDNEQSDMHLFLFYFSLKQLQLIAWFYLLSSFHTHRIWGPVSLVPKTTGFANSAKKLRISAAIIFNNTGGCTKAITTSTITTGSATASFARVRPLGFRWAFLHCRRLRRLQRLLGLARLWGLGALGFVVATIGSLSFFAVAEFSRFIRRVAENSAIAVSFTVTEICDEDCLGTKNRRRAGGGSAHWGQAPQIDRTNESKGAPSDLRVVGNVGIKHNQIPGLGVDVGGAVDERGVRIFIQDDEGGLALDGLAGIVVAVDVHMGVARDLRDGDGAKILHLVLLLGRQLRSGHIKKALEEGGIEGGDTAALVRFVPDSLLVNVDGRSKVLHLIGGQEARIRIDGGGECGGGEDGRFAEEAEGDGVRAAVGEEVHDGSGWWAA